MGRNKHLFPGWSKPRNTDVVRNGEAGGVVKGSSVYYLMIKTRPDSPYAPLNALCKVWLTG